MALGKDLINLGSCGLGSSLGFNTNKGCKQRMVAANKIGTFIPGSFLDPNVEWNYAYFLQLIEEGKVDILSGVRTFEENGGDDTIETIEDGTELLTNEGKYKFYATFTNGLFFNKAMHSAKGFGSRDVFIIDNEGSIILTKHLSGGAKGFTTGIFQPGKLQMPSNSVGMKETLMFQFLERFELDENYAIIEAENLDFNPKQLEGVSQVDLSFVNDPANADTTITFDAVLSQDNKTALEGLVANDLQLLVNDVAQTVTPVGVVGVSKRYTATVPALSTSDKLEFRLYNTTDSRIVINKDSSLYKSLTLTKLVA